jgi:hypothetical protein
MTDPQKQVRCRAIVESDRPSLIDLLSRGFPARSQAYWVQAIERLFDYTKSGGYPQAGYVLDRGGMAVGVLLTIYAPGRDGDRSLLCNLSSWHVDEDVRPYATLLVSRALRDRSITYINISPERHTYRAIGAQGFSPYSKGIVVGFPAIAPRREKTSVEVVTEDRASWNASSDEIDLVRIHSRFGCLSLWCVVADGAAHPFIFIRRPRLKGLLPVAQLGYCRSTEEFARFARPIGRALAKRGIFGVMVDANEPIAGLPGIYLPGRSRRFARGPRPPRLGDLAFTEAAMFGL